MPDTVLDKGTVIEVRNGIARVSLRENAECEQCGARILCAPDASGERSLVARNSLNARIGEQVVVKESRDILLRLSLLQYGLPLLGFLLGVFIIYLSGITAFMVPIELVSFLAGLGGIAISGWYGRKWASSLAKKSDMYFEITKIYNGEDHEENG